MSSMRDFDASSVLDDDKENSFDSIMAVEAVKNDTTKKCKSTKAAPEKKKKKVKAKPPADQGISACSLAYNSDNIMLHTKVFKAVL